MLETKKDIDANESVDFPNVFIYEYIYLNI